MSIASEIESMAKQAHAASRVLATAATDDKNAALLAIADKIKESAEHLKAANLKDCETAKSNGLSDALIKRLLLRDKQIDAVCDGLEQIVDLPDPVGARSEMQERPSGIRVGTMRVPLGVIGIIYESRPNVTADAAGLCLKSGNAVILRGGSEAIHSNCALADCITDGLTQVGLPPACVRLVRTVDRAAVDEMLKCDQYIDVIIPRGGKSLVKKISTESRIPVIKHLDGICHVFVDRDADLDKALAIAVNAKTQHYGVCNAMETLLVDASVASVFLPKVAAALGEKGVEIRSDEQAHKCLPKTRLATEQDWHTEYLSPILSIRVVDGVAAAIDHIEQYGSHHTDAIVTENPSAMDQFIGQVDSGSVVVNASTRFADGFEYGLGAEIGISTDKLHARGPVGLEGLTTYKYIVLGEGQIRE